MVEGQLAIVIDIIDYSHGFDIGETIEFLFMVEMEDGNHHYEFTNAEGLQQTLIREEFKLLVDNSNE